MVSHVRLICCSTCLFIHFYLVMLLWFRKGRLELAVSNKLKAGQGLE